MLIFQKVKICQICHILEKNIIEKTFFHHRKSLFIFMCENELVPTDETVLKPYYIDKNYENSNIIDLFMDNDKYSFYILKCDLGFLIDFISQNNLPSPSNLENININLEKQRNFYLIKKNNNAENDPQHNSPKFYNISDQSSIIIAKTEKTISSDYSLWCNHQHSTSDDDIQTNSHGVNYANKCLFSIIHPSKIKVEIRKKIKTKYSNFKYDNPLIKLTYESKANFEKFLTFFYDSPYFLTIYPETVLIKISSIVKIQSALRMFSIRNKFFKNIKQIVLEKRAMITITNGIKNKRIKNSLHNLNEIIQYYKTLPKQNYFFMPGQYYNFFMNQSQNFDIDFLKRDNYLLEDKRTLYFLYKILNFYTKIKSIVQFGFGADKSIVLAENHNGFLPQFIPTGKIMFSLNDLHDIISVGSVSVEAKKKMLSVPISEKLLKRFHFIKIVFTNFTEARRRLVLFSYLTNSFKIFMNDKDVLEYCSANAIKYNWYGYSTRKYISNLLFDKGFKIKIFKKPQTKIALNKYEKQSNEDSKMPCINNEKLEIPNANYSYDIDERKGKFIAIGFDIKENIHQLRNDYRPWVHQLEAYKKIREKYSEFPSIQPQPEPYNDEDESINTLSALNLGLITRNDIPKILTCKLNTDVNLPSTTEKRKYDFGEIDFYSSKNNFPNPLFYNFEDSEEEDENNETERREGSLKESTNALVPEASTPNNTLESAIANHFFKSRLEKDKPQNLNKNFNSNCSKSLPKFAFMPLVDSYSILNEEIDDAHLMAPFFTGSPKHKIRGIKQIPKSKSLSNLIHTPHSHPTNNNLNLDNFFTNMLKDENEENEKNSVKLDTDLPQELPSSDLELKPISPREQIKIVFSKLVRLYKLGNLINNGAQTTKSFDNNHINYQKARDELLKTHSNSIISKTKYAADAQKRASVEKAIILNKIEKQRKNAIKEKTKKASIIRQSLKSNREKYNKNRAFGINFVSMSQQLSRRIEMNKKSSLIKRPDVVHLKMNILNKKMNLKEINHEIAEQKREIAFFDKITLENRKQMMDAERTKRINSILEIKRKEKERRSQMKSTRSSQSMCIPEPAGPYIFEDECISASKSIGEYIGFNLGTIESQLLVDIIYNIL